MNACSDALKWLESQKELKSAWENCERGDWMLWLLNKTTNKSDELSLRRLTLVKARCAKIVIHLMNDERSRNAVLIAEQYGLGNAIRSELDAAAYAADAAARAARKDILVKAANEVRSVFKSPPEI